MIEGGCDPVEIFEESLAVRLNEVTGIRRRVAARLKNCECIDPALAHIKANAVAVDLYKAGNMAINDAVKLRQ